MDKQSTFADWLLAVITERGVSRADLARLADVSPTAISDVINGKRSAGSRLCLSIARALDLPPDLVFRKAGLLPQEKEVNETLEIANHLLAELPTEYQQEALELIRVLHERHAPYNV